MVIRWSENMYSMFLMIVCKFGKKRLVSNRLMKFSEIKSINEVYGQYDIIVKIEANNPKEMEDFLQNKIRTIDDIDKIETAVIAETGFSKDEEIDEEPDVEDYENLGTEQEDEPEEEIED